MRKLFVLLAVAAVATTMLAAPALADRPVQFSESMTFQDFDPCSGELDTITINVDVSVHEHRNNLVVHAARSGSTLLGYEMIAGAESFVANKNVERGTFFDQWRHPDGRKYKVHGSFVFNANQEELKVQRFRITCIGNG